MKVLIIGKKSFLGNNLFTFLKKKKFNVKIISFNEIRDINVLLFTHVINFSISKKYLIEKINKHKNIDFKIIKLFKKNKNIKYFFFSTRKIYEPKINIKEKSKKSAKCFYSKNKLITENILKSEINKKNLICLRLSNIIGNQLINNKKKVHKTFIDIYKGFREMKKKKIRLIDSYKDFITIEQFCIIISKILVKNIYGTYNLSSGNKISVKQILFLFDTKFFKKFVFYKFDKSLSFTLNNDKLSKKINYKPKFSDLKKYCENLFNKKSFN